MLLAVVVVAAVWLVVEVAAARSGSPRRRRSRVVVVVVVVVVKAAAPQADKATCSGQGVSVYWLRLRHAHFIRRQPRDGSMHNPSNSMNKAE